MTKYYLVISSLTINLQRYPSFPGNKIVLTQLHGFGGGFATGHFDDMIQYFRPHFLYGLVAFDHRAGVDVNNIGIRCASLVLEETLITGVTGFPVGVPRPVVKRMMLAPEPARPVVDSTSLPGVQRRFNPGMLTYSV